MSSPTAAPVLLFGAFGAVQACAAFADGYPLVVGTVIADGYLEKLEFGEVGCLHAAPQPIFVSP